MNVGIGWGVKEIAKIDAMESNLQEAFKTAMLELEGEVEKAWEDESRTGLNASEKTRDVYMSSLRFSHTKDSVVVEGNGWLPRFLEFGARRFDMKRSLAAGGQRIVPLEINGQLKFRTMREGQRGKWIHPGLDARRIRDRVFDKVFGKKSKALGGFVMKVFK